MSKKRLPKDALMRARRKRGERLVSAPLVRRSKRRSADESLSPARTRVATLEAPEFVAIMRVSRLSTPRGEMLLQAKARATSEFLRVRPQRAQFSSYAADMRPAHNVVGIGIGRKLEDGEDTGAVSIRFYVERKLPAEVIPEDMLLPSSIEGIPTDVIESGRFRAYPATAPVNTMRLRPAVPGCSVGFRYEGANAARRMAGTLGALVRNDDGLYILSNNHVLANENRLAIGRPIFQPGLLDGGDPSADAIAKLSRFHPLANGVAVDAAIAEVNDSRLVEPVLLPEIGRLQSSESQEPTEGMEVEKVGRTTGYRKGRVVDVLADVNVEYSSGVYQFVDQLLIEGEGEEFSQEGDSGSLVVSCDAKRPIGLVCAGAGSLSVANRIAAVLESLGVGIVV